MFHPLLIPGIASTAYGINDLGQIVGDYTDTEGSIYGFLAAPVPDAAIPEPGSFALMGLGICGVNACRKL